MDYFNFNENKHAPEQFGSDADLKGYEIEQSQGNTGVNRGEH